MEQWKVEKRKEEEGEEERRCLESFKGPNFQLFHVLTFSSEIFFLFLSSFISSFSKAEKNFVTYRNRTRDRSAAPEANTLPPSQPLQPLCRFITLASDLCFQLPTFLLFASFLLFLSLSLSLFLFFRNETGIICFLPLCQFGRVEGLSKSFLPAALHLLQKHQLEKIFCS